MYHSLQRTCTYVQAANICQQGRHWPATATQAGGKSNVNDAISSHFKDDSKLSFTTIKNQQLRLVREPKHHCQCRLPRFWQGRFTMAQEMTARSYRHTERARILFITHSLEVYQLQRARYQKQHPHPITKWKWLKIGHARPDVAVKTRSLHTAPHVGLIYSLISHWVLKI